MITDHDCGAIVRSTRLFEEDNQQIPIAEGFNRELISL